MLATFMEVLDTSVANVALPHIAGSLSATAEEATWVLTSYLVANAIILPMSGWLANYFGRRRTLLAVVLTAIYVAMPWIQINGNPMLFLDVKHRQFHYFGLTFVSQDIWVVFFVMSGIGFCLFFLTSLLGRVWCGWACPQTIFLDVARRIERWCEGDATERRKLDVSPWTMNKTVRRVAKHTLYVLYALLLAHVLLSYFVSIPGLYAMMRHSPAENFKSFAFVFLIAGALWFNFATGWHHEDRTLLKPGTPTAVGDPFGYAFIDGSTGL